MPFRHSVPLPVHYGDALLDCGYIADIIVGDRVILDCSRSSRLCRCMRPN